MPRFPWSLLSALLLAACSHPPDQPAPLPTLPATYSGRLPCADCPGIRLTLTLWPDSSFYLERVRFNTDEDKEQVEHEIGGWHHQAGRIVLEAADPLMSFQVGSTASRLYPLTADGQPEKSLGSAFLAHDRALEPPEPRLDITGMVSHREGALRVRECYGGREFVVIPGGDSPALDEAWTRMDADTGSSLLGSFSVRIGLSRGSNGDRAPVMYIDHFSNLAADEDCPGGEE
jgi:copper homeostasis protein (lipoprotein)